MKQFENDESTQIKVDEFFRLGFTQMKLPGGTSLKEEHYSGIIFYFYNEEIKKMFFLAVPYNPKVHEDEGEDEDKGTRKHTKKNGEREKETGRREGYEETGLLVEEDDLCEVYSYSVRNRKDSNALHNKHFYLAKDFHGTLSDFEYKGNPIDPETSTPIWMSASLFNKVLYDGHMAAFKKAVNCLANENRDYFYSLMEII